MTPTEQRYDQIEKEALALTRACKHFEDYLFGLHFTIEIDHNPLVSLFGKKLLDELMNTTLSYANDAIQFQHSTCPGKGPHDCRRTIYLERQFRNLLRVAHNLEKR